MRSTGIVLNTLVEANAPSTSIAADGPVDDGRAKRRPLGQHTGERVAMESLVNYYRKYETTVPNFSAVVRFGGDEIAQEQFRSRSVESKAVDLPMPQVLAKGPAGVSQPLDVHAEGTGTLFYATRLRYAADVLYQQGLDNGFRIERRYEPYRRNRIAAGVDQLQGWRSRAGSR